MHPRFTVYTNLRSTLISFAKSNKIAAYSDVKVRIESVNWKIKKRFRLVISKFGTRISYCRFGWEISRFITLINKQTKESADNVKKLKTWDKPTGIKITKNNSFLNFKETFMWERKETFRKRGNHLLEQRSALLGKNFLHDAYWSITRGDCLYQSRKYHMAP